LRDGYAKLKDVLPVSNQKSSKVSLLERGLRYLTFDGLQRLIDTIVIATNHIINLEHSTTEMQTRLARLEQEVKRLRAINEKISLGLDSTPSPGNTASLDPMDHRPLSPPPDGPMPHSLASVKGQEPPREQSGSPSASDGYWSRSSPPSDSFCSVFFCFCIAFHSAQPRFRFISFWVSAPWPLEKEILVFEEKVELEPQGIMNSAGTQMGLVLTPKPSTSETLRLEAVGWVAEVAHTLEPRTVCLIDIKPNLVDRLDIFGLSRITSKAKPALPSGWCTYSLASQSIVTLLLAVVNI
jgi:hypothetical protein